MPKVYVVTNGFGHYKSVFYNRDKAIEHSKSLMCQIKNNQEILVRHSGKVATVYYDNDPPYSVYQVEEVQIADTPNN